MAKYGAGEKSTIKCTTCDYEKEIQLSGTHESEGGSLKVYCEYFVLIVVKSMVIF